MTAKFDWDKYEDVGETGKFDWDEYDTVPTKRSRTEKAARLGAQYGLGLADRAMLPLSIQSSVLSSPQAQHAEFRKNIFEDIERLAEQKATGVWDKKDEELFQELQEQIKSPERAAPFVKTADISPSALIKKGIKKTTGYDLEPEGAGEHIAEFAGSFKPKEIFDIAKSIPKAVQKLKAVPQKLKSGLTKPRASESKLSSIATIGKKTQEKAITKLNKEAAELSRKSLHKHLPLAKKVEQGMDSSILNRNFEHLDKAAYRSNALVDLEPVESLLDGYIEKFKGIPSPHSDAKKIILEIRNFRKKPPNTVNKAYKTYRSNNKKLKEISETAFVTGKQAGYAKFLRDQNKAIADSFRETLGKDHAFVQYFDMLNNQHAKLRTAENTLRELEPVLEGRNLTPKALAKLAYDPKTQKKLTAISKNEQFVKEISDIAKDLSVAKEAIKNIPKSSLSKYDAVLPLTFLIPGIGPILKAIGIPYESVKISRHLVGYFLSRPETRRAYKQALDALIKNDIGGYQAASSILRSSLESPEED